MKTITSMCQRSRLAKAGAFGVRVFALAAVTFVLLFVDCPNVLAKTPVLQSASAQAELEELNQRILAAVQRAKPACVAVSESRGGHASFSAVIASKDGYVLTAGHCIEPDRDYYLHLDDGRTIKAKSLGKSEYLDIGLMRIVDDVDFPWVEMGRSAELVRNQTCLSISHPDGFNRARGLVTRFGHVVAFNNRGHIENTCLMEPGDSGGGLFDLDGRVIGIHSYIRESLDHNYDMPIDHFHRYWDLLCEPANFTPAYAVDRFGIQLSSEAGLERGAEIESIVDHSPAAQAGLKRGDIIVEFNGDAVDADYALDRQLRRAKRRSWQTVKLVVLRGEDEMAVDVKVDSPDSPTLSDSQSAQYNTWSDLANVLAGAEDELDDATVRITSQVFDEAQSVIGTVVDIDGRVLSKSSCVGERPMIKGEDGRELAGEVLWRDDATDLVMLRVDSLFKRAVDLSFVDSRLPSAAESGLLLSPRPGPAGGLVSVVGSRRFTSPPRKQYGYLGVMPAWKVDRVVLISIEDGPAKRASLQPMDAVLKVDNVAIDSVAKLVNTIRSHDPGKPVVITIERQSEQQSVEVVLGTRPEAMRHIADSFDGGSSSRRAGFDSVFCHDSHATPSECGGPLFDMQGNFIGLNIARFSRTHCYALPADIVRETVERKRRH